MNLKTERRGQSVSLHSYQQKFIRAQHVPLCRRDISLAQGWMMTPWEKGSPWMIYRFWSQRYMRRFGYCTGCYTRIVFQDSFSCRTTASNDTISISSYITPKTSAAYCYALFGKWFTSWYTVWPRIIPQNTQYTIDASTNTCTYTLPPEADIQEKETHTGDWISLMSCTFLLGMVEELTDFYLKRAHLVYRRI